MFTDILSKISSHPAQMRVALKALELGLSIYEGKIWCSDIELSVSAIARAVGTDRRAVKAAVDFIGNDKELSKLFSKLRPIASFKELAPLIGWGVIEIVPEDSKTPGILAGVSTKIAEKGISIRQTIADDPDLKEEPKLFVITETPVPPALIIEIKKVKGVKSIVIW
jgi:predicted regulator of amino acid metabolism with ACT domain